MAILSTPVEKAAKRLADVRAELDGEQAALTADLPFEENVAARQRIDLLKHKEAAAIDALTYAQEQEAAEADKAQNAKEVAEVEAYQRAAKRELPALCTKYAKHAEGAAAALAAIDAHARCAAHINTLARKHGLPPVTDGETLFRATAVKHIPAQYEEREVWVDGAGNKPTVFHKASNGEMVPEQGGYMKARERVLVSPERTEGGTLPGGRLSAAVKLVDLNGRTIWPAS
jgi:hypothetical protein